jgi:hypothetical protein
LAKEKVENVGERAMKLGFRAGAVAAAVLFVEPAGMLSHLEEECCDNHKDR